MQAIDYSWKETVGIFVMYDITDVTSYDTCIFWAKKLKEFIPSMYILGNKVDLEVHRQVRREVAQNFADRNQAFFYEISTIPGVTPLPIFDAFYRLLSALVDGKQFQQTIELSFSDPVSFQSESDVINGYYGIDIFEPWKIPSWFYNSAGKLLPLVKAMGTS